MTVKYLYLDDESTESVQSFIRVIKNNTDLIDIYSEKPRPFDEQIGYLLENINIYDGIILDWRLDDKPTDTGVVRFRAGALAQELRSRSSEGEIKDLPIILWSTDEKLSASYNRDDTSHDLFDSKYLKENIPADANRIRDELVSFAAGYKKAVSAIVLEQSPLTTLMYIGEENYDFLDVRFVSFFSSDYRKPVHEYARFIFREAVRTPGVLIDEKLLAARLGINLDISADWEHLLRRLPDECSYKGIFSDAWPRWWASIFEEKWWQSLDPKIPPLSIINADERVDLLKKYTGLQNLIAAEPIIDSYGTYFHTICEYYQRPLDTVDGVIVATKETFPWQDKRYISLDAALERKGENKGIRPHPTEVERLKEIRRSRSENEQN